MPSKSIVKSPVTEFITIGIILSPWGTQGKLKVEVATDFPERFDAPSQVYVKRQPVTIDSAEWHKGKVIVKLDVVNSILANDATVTCQFILR